MTRRHPCPARASRAAAAALALAALFAAASLLGSCSPRLGWGLVLWTAPEGPLPAGSIVPVFIKSNIQKVYVVGVPGAKSAGKKIELPTWQIDLFPTRRAAAARVKAMGENVGLYMMAARDGLPLRDQPSNSGKRVYRLREGQSVKVLAKVEGEAVSTGGQVLPGSWYQVLSDDGTVGFIFSFALRIYDESKEGPPVLASARQALTGRVDLIFSRSWRPEFFQEMLDDARIDLDWFSLRYGVFVDAVRRQVRIELPAASQVFNYTAVTEAEGLYSFEGTPLRIRIESDKRMTCSWTGIDDAAKAEDLSAQADAVAAAAADQTPAADSAPAAAPEGYASAGSGGSAVFVVLTADALESIRAETLRRQKLLGTFVDFAGGIWGAASSAASDGGGRLEINKNGRFTWKLRGERAGAFVPPGAGDSGEVAFRLFVDPAIAASWNGAISFRFDVAEGTKARREWKDFLYRRSPAGLVLAPASPSPGSLVVQAADARAEPLVLEPGAE